MRGLTCEEERRRKVSSAQLKNKLRHTSQLFRRMPLKSLSLIHYVQLGKRHTAVPPGTVQNRKTYCQPRLEASPLFSKVIEASLSLVGQANTG